MPRTKGSLNVKTYVELLRGDGAESVMLDDVNLLSDADLLSGQKSHYPRSKAIAALRQAALERGLLD